MKAIYILAALFQWVALTPPIFAFESSHQIQAIVAFGDSLTDSGNLYQFMQRQLPLSPPYYEGRFSDGPVWVETLTQLLSQHDAQITLENYAFGGAVVLDDDLDDEEDDDLVNATLTLRSQINRYFKQHNDEINPDALYTIMIGGNDYTIIDQASVDTLHAVISEIQTQVKRLIDHGAQHILISNLPDMGKSPIAQSMESEIIWTELSYRHNAQIFEMVEQFKKQYPNIHWIHLDIFSFFTDAHFHPEHYGYEYTMTPCYDLDEEFEVNADIFLFSSHLKLGEFGPKDCSKYLFFDIVHPTQKGHQVTAKLAYDLIRAC